MGEEEITAVVGAASVVGDTGFYVGFPDSSEWTDEERFHFVPSDKLTLYEEIPQRTPFPYVIDHVVYSPSAQWGMLRSLDDIAVVGGVAAYTRELLKSYPAKALKWQNERTPRPLVAPRDQIRSFLTAQAYLGKLDEARAIVRHVEGERAESLLAEFAGISPLHPGK